MIEYQPIQQAEPKGDPRDYRKELWIGVVISGAVNRDISSSPVSHADYVLAEFDRRFKYER